MEEKQIAELIKELKALKVREATVIAQLEAVNLKRTQKTAPPVTYDTEDELVQGDRIRITNRVRKPATWPRKVEWEERKERHGTVTRVTTEQVHIVTDNGTHTWRAPQNLKRITKDPIVTNEGK
jgi:hypothetical protein